MEIYSEASTMTVLIVLILFVTKTVAQCPDGSFLDPSCSLLDIRCRGFCRNGSAINEDEIDRDHPLFEGDIILNPKHGMKTVRNSVRDFSLLWESKIIPVVISGFTYNDYQTIIRGLRTIEDYTCLTFVNRTSQTDYIEVYRGSGCFSAVGRVGGKQYLSLGNGCVYVGTVMHEFMHALGFYHEQSRTDRDSSVYIAFENVYPGQEYNFNKYDKEFITDLNQPYDYASLMHYTRDAFSKNGKDTIIPLQPNVELIHSAYKYVPSVIDAKKLNILYNCTSPPNPPTAPPVTPPFTMFKYFTIL